MRSIAATSLIVLLAAPLALAQERGAAPGNLHPQAVAERQAVEIAARVPLEKPIKGAPYSADTIVESTQTLADGNHINRKTTGRVYRDSDGRVRREQEGAMSVVTAENPIVRTKGLSITIVDPVGGYTYSLNPEQKIAWRTPLGASKELLDKINAVAAQRSSQALTAEQKAQTEKEIAATRERRAQTIDAPSKASSEAIMRARGGVIAYAVAAPGPLEHKTIDGLAVEGRQHTETIPAGQVGNELPIIITSEEWTSTDLKVLVLTKHTDPRTGESSYRLSNIVRAEPDPSLFMVPPDYTVKDTNIRRNDE